MKSPLLGIAVTALVALNSATFYYVLSVERRLTRLEVMAELTRVPGLRLHVPPDAQRADAGDASSRRP